MIILYSKWTKECMNLSTRLSVQ